MKKLLIILLIASLSIGALAFSASAATLSPAIEVLSYKTDSVKAGLYNCDVIFTESDFLQYLGLSEIKSITFTSVPPAEDGYLYIGNTVIKDGTKVNADMLSYLRFRAASAEIDSTEFTYTAADGYAGSDHNCRIVFLSEINASPTVEIKSAVTDFTTYENIPLYSTLSAYDPEGDELTFKIVKGAKKGTVEIVSENAGSFVYTPKKNRTGKDSFSYVVSDKYGNYSEIQTVTVKTEKNRSKTVFTDMNGSPAHSAAITAVSNGIMNAVTVGKNLYFDPYGEITRSEMLAMMMEAAGISVQNNFTDVFADSDEIPEIYKGYVNTAVKLGIIKGSMENGKTVFRPNDAVTRAEAAVIAKAILGESNTAVQTFADSSSVPDWCSDAIRSAISYKLMLPDISGEISPSAKMTRADAAIMISGIIGVKQ